MAIYGLLVEDSLVTGHMQSSADEWPADPQPNLRQVTQATYESVVNGSRANPDGSYSPPPVVPPVLGIRKTAFIEILTPQEYVELLGPQTDPQLAWGVGLYHAAQDPFATEDPKVKMLLNYCAQIGRITQARADDIYAQMIAASKILPA